MPDDHQAATAHDLLPKGAGRNDESPWTSTFVDLGRFIGDDFKPKWVLSHALSYGLTRHSRVVTHIAEMLMFDSRHDR